ncbi:DUF6327 family protein [Wenyingzhuangia sp. 2_MG-2023]|uniref:DUF6327 family protein n=1 Tax=Wenyingzhuangia sp. 2_MG-2023 TaxID=3062639 RepID=UPI0026E26C47|nr:DUF6327 family protein [Wenyingzhuangia sp. 2_MG-2023]MDO6737495.1 DUF6327 family protein [Wenyingzhuangia sp. 2_MG-2023]
MKKYRSFNEIDQDLKILKLKKNIASEEIKLLKHMAIENMNPYKWIQPVLISLATKYGLSFLARKL